MLSGDQTKNTIYESERRKLNIDRNLSSVWLCMPINPLYDMLIQQCR
jgi:hypothetical protein